MYLAMMTRNAVLEIIVRLLWELRRDHLWDTLNRRALTREHRDAYLEDHRRIFACVTRRDGPGARQEMLRHLLGVEKHFLTS
jgi:DNA-binding FadR family transcriptional regulator